MLCPPRNVRRVRLAAVTFLTTVLAAIAGTTAPSAHADTIASKRAEARQVEAQIQAFDLKLEGTMQRYDGAIAHLRRVRTQIRLNTSALRSAQHDLRQARGLLRGLLVGVYKEGQTDSSAYIFTSTSVQELIDNIDVANRTTRAETDLLAQIAAAKRQIIAKRKALESEKGQAVRLVSQAAAAKKRAQQQLAERKRMLGSLNSQIRRLIDQREQRRAALAAQRAAAAQSAPPPVIATGGPIPPASSVGQQAVMIAEQYLGVPYVWGGASPSGFDCSGLTMYVYAQLGIQLSHYTGDQWNEGVHVSQDQLAPGDLVFFDGLGHEGMYIGGGQFIHAPHTGDVVKISSMSDSWYAQTYDGAVRVTG